MAHRQTADLQRFPPVLGDREAPGTTDKIDRFLAIRWPSLPCVVIDLDLVRARCLALRASFPNATIFYAVKANPAADILAALASVDAEFDLASLGEIERCLKLGIAPDRLSFGNTIKRETEIVRAYRNGIDRFAFDSIGEVEKIARAAPDA